MSQQCLSYKIKNWSHYNQSLINRGRITLWIPEEIEAQWQANCPSSSKGGRPYIYSDLSIEICLTIKSAYRLPYRGTQGFIESLFEWSKIDLPVPTYTQMHRRSRGLSIDLSRSSVHQGALDIVIDSTGLKVYGEGEWKVRQHGVSKRRTWKKLHLGIDPLNHEIRCFQLTGNNTSDGQVFDQLLEQIDAPIERCAADGAYDHQSCYEYCHQRGIQLLTPPRRDAVKQRSNQAKVALIPRDEAIERIQALFLLLGDKDKAQKIWKMEVDYHIRSISETGMYRFKTLCGNRLFSRQNATQASEVAIKVNIVNKLTRLGMPHSCAVQK